MKEIKIVFHCFIAALLKNKSIAHAALLPVIVFGSAGCTAAVPYVSNNSSLDVQPATSEYHVITYLRVYEDDGEIVLYGKVEHRHEHSDVEPHVDVAIKDPSGKEVTIKSIPLRQITGHKQRGRYGASFRTKINPAPTSKSQIVVAIHDSRCRTTDGVFDCIDNRAVTGDHSSIKAAEE